MTDTDNMQIVLQAVEGGMVRCLYNSWPAQRACSLAKKSLFEDRCMYYYPELNHCWLPKHQPEGE